MQTFTLNIQDGFVKDFLAIIEHYKDKVQLQKDENLEYDSYFYERRKELHSIKNDIDNGKIQMLENDEFWDDIDDYVKTLQK